MITNVLTTAMSTKANDIALVEPPTGAPLILAIYTNRRAADAAFDNTLIARTATALVRSLVRRSREHNIAGDWARQYDLAMDTIRWSLGQAGVGLEDVVRRRTFTVEGAKQNRAHGEGPTPFAKSHPTSLGCRISGLARPELVVEVEVSAVKGAGANIQAAAAEKRSLPRNRSYAGGKDG